jgi:hypothetical protein
MLSIHEASSNRRSVPPNGSETVSSAAGNARAMPRAIFFCCTRLAFIYRENGTQNGADVLDIAQPAKSFGTFSGWTPARLRPSRLLCAETGNDSWLVRARRHAAGLLACDTTATRRVLPW